MHSIDLLSAAEKIERCSMRFCKLEIFCCFQKAVLPRLKWQNQYQLFQFYFTTLRKTSYNFKSYDVSIKHFHNEKLPLELHIMKIKFEFKVEQEHLF